MASNSQSRTCQHEIWKHHAYGCSFLPCYVPLPRIALVDTRLPDEVLAVDSLCTDTLASWTRQVNSYPAFRRPVA